MITNHDYPERAEADFGETIRFNPIMQEIRRNEEVQKLRAEYGKKLVEAIERLDQAGKEITDRTVLLPIVEEFKKKLSKIK